MMPPTPPPYLQVEADSIARGYRALNNAEADVIELSQQIREMQARLVRARQFVADLAQLPLRQRALELLCADGGWELPTPNPDNTPPSSGPAPDPTSRFAQPKASTDDGGVVCGWPECGGTLLFANGTWVHATTWYEECTPPAGDATTTRPDLHPAEANTDLIPVVPALDAEEADRG